MKNITVFILLIFPFLCGKVLLPQEKVNGESLYIHDRVREYYILDNNSYIVSGPSIVSVYSRLAVPKDVSGRHSFSITSILSNSSGLIHEFSKKVDSSVSSSLHPMHRYTKSAKVEINIPNGEFILYLENSSQIGNPILTRVIQKKPKN